FGQIPAVLAPAPFSAQLAVDGTTVGTGAPVTLATSPDLAAGTWVVGGAILLQFAVNVNGYDGTIDVGTATATFGGGQSGSVDSFLSVAGIDAGSLCLGCIVTITAHGTLVLQAQASGANCIARQTSESRGFPFATGLWGYRIL